MAARTPADLDAEVTRKTEDEIDQLARDTSSGLVWVSYGEGRDLDPFEGVLRMTIRQASQGFVKSVGLVYEYLDQSVASLADERPLFISARFLHRDDLALFVEQLKTHSGTKENDGQAAAE